MQIKKALIFAAGFGTRLAPLTQHLPKPLVEVAGKALIQYHIEKLVKLGVTELVINTHWLSEKLVQALGDGSAFGAKIIWSHEPQILETGGGMQQALAFLGDHPFIVVSADIWTDYSFVSLLNEGLDSVMGNCFAHLVMVKNPPHNSAGDFLLQEEEAWIDGHCQFSVSQKPLMTQSTFAKEASAYKKAYTYAGIGLFRPEFIGDYLASLPEGFNIDRQPYPLRKPLINAIEKKRVSAQIHPGYWQDIGTMARLNELKAYLAQG